MADQHNTHRAQYRVCVPQVLACIRRNIAVDTRGGNRMRESCKYGSVRGARGNSRPYRAFWLHIAASAHSRLWHKAAVSICDGMSAAGES